MKTTPPDYVLDYVAKYIAGEIVLNNKPGSVIRKWREIYGLSQIDASRLINIKPSVLSDYERDRRRAGRRFIEKFIKTLFIHDSKRGWNTTVRIAKLMNIYVDGIIDIGEFIKPIGLDELIMLTDGILLSNTVIHRPVYGYTIIDSVKAVKSLTASEYVKLMGSTSDRVVVFTNITRGRSVMVAVRVSPVKPSIVILHNVQNVDTLALNIAIL
ncbi:MAG: helix-turn-helix domain-containing protein, partial [Desulfurococcaceae archaeon]